MPKVKAILNKNNSYLFATITCVLLVYCFSLFRPWLPFDERVFFKEVLFPIPSRIDEIKEIIDLFASNYHIESMNTFFSNNLTIRSNPIAARLIILTSWLFKKHAFLYHLLQLTIHLINTGLVWIIFYKTTNFFSASGVNEKESFPDKKLIIISLFTLIWALHSASSEAILLTTNWSTILTYTFCLSFILFEISKIMKNDFSFSIFKIFVVSVLFILTMFLTEYGYTLPAIIFFITFSYSIKQTGKLNTALQISLKYISPYFIGLLAFIFLSSFKANSPITNLLNQQSIYTALERNLWLTPQIFIHLLKLLLFPKTLSLYQSDLTTYSQTLINPYSILCTSIYLIFLVLPLIFLFISKTKELKSLCLLIYAFFFSLFPFLHIILPTYCLSADRYCYFPSFFLILLIVITIFALPSKLNKSKATIIVLSSVLALLTARTLIRINEWNNPYLLYKASAEAERSPLYKAHKLIIFSSYLSELGKYQETSNSLEKSITLLTKSLKELKKLKLKYPNQPITLRQYGLDIDSLILKNAYLIATVKYDNYKESSKDILNFYKQYIKNNLKLAFVSQLTFYAELLSANDDNEQAKSVLEYGLQRFPYSSAILLAFTEYCLQRNELDNAFSVLEKAYKIFPNDSAVISKFYKYHELKHDLPNQARFAYLLGLRNHDTKGYQKAVQIYLGLKDLRNAKIALKKLIRLTGETPLTILFTTNYLDLVGNRKEILPLLVKAYVLTKTQSEKEDIQVTKIILASLININTLSGNTQEAKNYLNEFSKINNLTKEDKLLITEFKTKLHTVGNKNQ